MSWIESEDFMEINLQKFINALKDIQEQAVGLSDYGVILTSSECEDLKLVLSDITKGIDYLSKLFDEIVKDRGLKINEEGEYVNV